jgi:hypothetical protein
MKKLLRETESSAIKKTVKGGNEARKNPPSWQSSSIRMLIGALVQMGYPIPDFIIRL